MTLLTLSFPQPYLFPAIYFCPLCRLAPLPTCRLPTLLTSDLFFRFTLPFFFLSFSSSSFIFLSSFAPPFLFSSIFSRGSSSWFGFSLSTRQKVLSTLFLFSFFLFFLFFFFLFHALLSPLSFLFFNHSFSFRGFSMLFNLGN